MEAPQQLKPLDLDERGQVVTRNTQDLERYFSGLIKSGSLPSHIKTVDHLRVAYGMLNGLGLNWLLCLRDTWVNPRTQQLALCNDAPLAAVRLCRDQYIATVEYHVNDRNERRTRENFVGFRIFGAVCIARRKGCDDVEGLYTVDEAKAAGLMNKDNWSKHTAAMLKMRARTIALRAQWADVLGGVRIKDDDDLYMPAQARKRDNALVIDMLGEEVTEPAGEPPPEAIFTPEREPGADEDG